MIRTTRLTLATMFLSSAVGLFGTHALAQDPPPSEPAPSETPATQPETPTPAPAPDAPAPAPDAPAPAPDAPAPDAAVAPATPSRSTEALVGDFMHYGRVARYDLANDAGQKLLASGAQPAEVLVAFENAAKERKTNFDEDLIRWQEIPQMKDITAQMVKFLNEGRYTRRSDAKFITDNIDRLINSERGYVNGIRALRDSGELAVPFLIQYLRDPQKTQYHSVIRRALRDMGKFSLSPLVASTEMNDWPVLAMICTSLGDLGYDVSVPYLAKVATMKDAPPATRTAAIDAIAAITGSKRPADTLRPGDLFYNLAEKLYYDTAAISTDPRNQMSYMWYWDADRGLVKIDVVPQIFNELMAMRATEYSLKLGGSSGDALSLWLASNYKREVELPEGTTDPTRAEGQPNAHYYGVSAGAQYLNAALARALKDNNAPVALKVVKSLQEIAGQSNAMPGGSGPLVDAMAFPDRIVRFEAAFAVAGSLPQQPFTGQERVVPLLAEALSQTGAPAVLLAAANQEQFNALSEMLKGGGFQVAGGTSADAALAQANALPAIDVVVISDEMLPPEVDRLLASNAQSSKVAGAAKLVMVKTDASPYQQRSVNDRMISTTRAQDAEALKAAIDEARQHAGGLPVDPAVATNYASRAADLLAKLAISRGQVLDLSAAQPALLGALTDARPDIVKLAGNVLGLFPSKEAQIGLFSVAADEKTADDVKISLYKSLSTNAKFFGNKLDTPQVQGLTKIVADVTNLDVRSAAAEAHGALNLPADEAKALIVKQSKI